MPVSQKPRKHKAAKVQYVEIKAPGLLYTRSGYRSTKPKWSFDHSYRLDAERRAVFVCRQNPDIIHCVPYSTGE